MGLSEIRILLALILPMIHGAYNPAVTQTTINKTICVPGWTSSIRPPVSYTQSLKIRQIAASNYVDENPSHYEEDHFIPLELGGSPRSPKNLWPEPWSQADKSDPLENQLHREVCNHTITLYHARRTIRAWKEKNG